MSMQKKQKKRSSNGLNSPVKTLIKFGILYKATKSVVNNLFRKQVMPKFGSVVYCDLAFGIAEHSGIYVGNNSIVHLNKDGLIEKVSLDDFIKNTPSITIYVSSRNGEAVGSEIIGRNALAQLGNQVKYDVLKRNCHQFSSGCLTQNFDNTDLLLTKLKRTTQQTLGANEWRVLAQ